jgi:hypothetical protein
VLRLAGHSRAGVAEEHAAFVHACCSAVLSYGERLPQLVQHALLGLFDGCLQRTAGTFAERRSGDCAAATVQPSPLLTLCAALTAAIDNEAEFAFALPVSARVQLGDAALRLLLTLHGSAAAQENGAADRSPAPLSVEDVAHLQALLLLFARAAIAPGAGLFCGADAAAKQGAAADVAAKRSGAGGVVVMHESPLLLARRLSAICDDIHAAGEEDAGAAASHGLVGGSAGLSSAPRGAVPFSPPHLPAEGGFSAAADALPYPEGAANAPTPDSAAARQHLARSYAHPALRAAAVTASARVACVLPGARSRTVAQLLRLLKATALRLNRLTADPASHAAAAGGAEGTAEGTVLHVATPSSGDASRRAASAGAGSRLPQRSATGAAAAAGGGLGGAAGSPAAPRARSVGEELQLQQALLQATAAAVVELAAHAPAAAAPAAAAAVGSSGAGAGAVLSSAGGVSAGRPSTATQVDARLCAAALDVVREALGPLLPGSETLALLLSGMESALAAAAAGGAPLAGGALSGAGTVAVLPASAASRSGASSLALRMPAFGRRAVTGSGGPGASATSAVVVAGYSAHASASASSSFGGAFAGLGGGLRGVSIGSLFSKGLRARSGGAGHLGRSLHSGRLGSAPEFPSAHATLAAGARLAQELSAGGGADGSGDAVGLAALARLRRLMWVSATQRARARATLVGTLAALSALELGHTPAQLTNGTAASAGGAALTLPRRAAEAASSDAWLLRLVQRSRGQPSFALSSSHGLVAGLAQELQAALAAWRAAAGLLVAEAAALAVSLSAGRFFAAGEAVFAVDAASAAAAASLASGSAGGLPSVAEEAPGTPGSGVESAAAASSGSGGAEEAGDARVRASLTQLQLRHLAAVGAAARACEVVRCLLALSGALDVHELSKEAADVLIDALVGERDWAAEAGAALQRAALAVGADAGDSESEEEMGLRGSGAAAAGGVGVRGGAQPSAAAAGAAGTGGGLFSRFFRFGKGTPATGATGHTAGAGGAARSGTGATAAAAAAAAALRAGTLPPAAAAALLSAQSSEGGGSSVSGRSVGLHEGSWDAGAASAPGGAAGPAPAAIQPLAAALLGRLVGVVTTPLRSLACGAASLCVTRSGALTRCSVLAEVLTSTAPAFSSNIEPSAVEAATALRIVPAALTALVAGLRTAAQQAAASAARVGAQVAARHQAQQAGEEAAGEGSAVSLPLLQRLHRRLVSEQAALQAKHGELRDRLLTLFAQVAADVTRRDSLEVAAEAAAGGGTRAAAGDSGASGGASAAASKDGSGSSAGGDLDSARFASHADVLRSLLPPIAFAVLPVPAAPSTEPRTPGGMPAGVSSEPAQAAGASSSAHPGYRQFLALQAAATTVRLHRALWLYLVLARATEPQFRLWHPALYRAVRAIAAHSPALVMVSGCAGCFWRWLWRVVPLLTCLRPL